MTWNGRRVLGPQGFLEDPVDPQVNARRQGVGFPFDAQLDRPSRASGALDRGRRSARPRVAVSRSREPHRRGEAPRRGRLMSASALSAGLLDRGHRPLGPRGVAGEHHLGGLRLDHHRAHVCGHEGVQLAGDPGALIGDGKAGAAVAFGLEPLGRDAPAPSLSIRRVRNQRPAAQAPQVDGDGGTDEVAGTGAGGDVDRRRPTPALPPRPIDAAGAGSLSLAIV